MDKFANHSTGLESPALDVAELVPDDNNDLAKTTRAIWVGTAGDVSVVVAGGGSAVFKNASGWMPLRVKRLNATNTTAADIVGAW